MATNNEQNDKFANALKAYVSPFLLTIVGLFIWRDLSEVRSDVKTLLEKQGGNQVRIETLQEDVTTLKAYVYGSQYKKINPQQPAKKEDELEIK